MANALPMPVLKRRIYLFILLNLFYIYFTFLLISEFTNINTYVFNSFQNMSSNFIEKIMSVKTLFYTKKKHVNPERTNYLIYLSKSQATTENKFQTLSKAQLLIKFPSLDLGWEREN